MLIDELQRQGDWLFRHRSFVPLLLIPLGILALLTHKHFFQNSALTQSLFELLCFLIALSGLIIRGIALGYAQPGSSGRNTQTQIADSLNTTGLYSAVRHPLYLGNILIVLGILLYTQSPFFILAGVLGYILFYERIIATEEAFLLTKFGDSFREWAQRTPALIPRFSHWVAPGMRFSFREAVKGEFYGFTAIVAALTALKTLDDLFATGRLHLDRFWLTFLGISFLLFLFLRYLRKHTRFFESS